MCDPRLRRLCTRAVGQQVVVRDRDGRVYRGVLHGMTDEGVIVRPVGAGPRVASATLHRPEEFDAQHAVSNPSDAVDAEPVFWWWWLIAWAIIAGFWWWGGAWGARGRYGAYGAPYGGYGAYGGGYGGGWGW